MQLHEHNCINRSPRGATRFRWATLSAVESPLVAVLGGGQLGRMLGLAAIPLGVRCRFLDPVAGAPAAAVGPLGEPAAELATLAHWIVARDH